MAEQTQITLNGEPRNLAAPASIASLLQDLQLQGRLAVEVNGTIVPRSEHAGHRLEAGDRVEIVRAVGGG
jgi:sulfur carrier protein